MSEANAVAEHELLLSKTLTVMVLANWRKRDTVGQIQEYEETCSKWQRSRDKNQRGTTEGETKSSYELKVTEKADEEQRRESVIK